MQDLTPMLGVGLGRRRAAHRRRDLLRPVAHRVIGVAGRAVGARRGRTKSL